MDTGKTTGETSRESRWGKMEPRPGGGMGMERMKSSAQILVTDGREKSEMAPASWLRQLRT